MNAIFFLMFSKSRDQHFCGMCDKKNLNDDVRIYIYFSESMNISIYHL